MNCVYVFVKNILLLQQLQGDLMVEDINGIRMPAMTIFAMSIQFLRDHLLKSLKLQMVGMEETDIQYVITVPAIWSDNAKQFMREASIQVYYQAGVLHFKHHNFNRCSARFLKRLNLSYIYAIMFSVFIFYEIAVKYYTTNTPVLFGGKSTF